MSAHNLISLADLSPLDLSRLVCRGLTIKQNPPEQTLRNKTVGIYFRTTSTRTRTSFSVGALKLGANIVTYSGNDLQTNTGETLDDTAAVLSAYLDALVCRTAGPIEEMRTLGNQDTMAVVNAMSECEHPTQAIADLTTMLEHFGHLDGLHVVYVGEGNNTATALCLALSRMPGMRLSLFTPEGYGVPPVFLRKAAEYCRESGACVEACNEISLASANADVVYTTRWQTTGTSKKDPDWRASFADYSVTPELMTRMSKGDGAVFMHDLPAVAGEDSSPEILRGPRSIVFRQAANKLYSAMAVLEWCISG